MSLEPEVENEREVGAVGMRKFVSVFGVSVGLLLASSSVSFAGDACYSVSGDEAAVARAWADASDACPCSEARSENWKVERNSYLKCVRNFVRTAVASGSLRKACKKEVQNAARESVCGRPSDAVTCCFTSSSGTECEIVPEASDCYHHSGRFAERGTSGTCMDACADAEGPVCLNHSDCDDNNSCTWDTCDLVNGCWNVNNGTCGPQPTPSPGGGGSGGTSCSGTGSSTHGLSAKETALANMINQYRRSKGKREVATCHSMNVAAQDHGNDERDRNYYSHTGKNGSTYYERMCDAGYLPGCGPSTYVGEILMAGVSTPEEALAAWKGSPGHDTIMRDNAFLVIGVGHACGGGRWGDYWVVEFAGASCR